MTHNPAPPRDAALPPDLRLLAEHAGIALSWSDEGGRPHAVAATTLQRVLTALGHACDTSDAIAASLQALDAARAAPALVTARVGERIDIPIPRGVARDTLQVMLTLESGATALLRTAVAPEEVSGAETSAVSFEGIETPGYHRLVLTTGGVTHSLGLVIAPSRAFESGLRRAWGSAVQLHALRPASTAVALDAGLGDFGALATLAGALGAAGADVLAISPTHAGFAADAVGFSPYSPSSRLFHNVLFIDPADAFGEAAAAEAARRAGIEAEAASLAAEALIDWPRAAALKMRWLRALFEAQAPAVARSLPEPLPEPLRLHATFEALHAHFLGEGLGDWRRWPAAFQRPSSAEVAAFAETHAAEIRFHAALQQLAEDGLRRSQRAAADAGMRVGLVTDLAIGMTAAGSHAWAAPDDLLGALEIGAPPDMLNANGQRWGLTTFSPLALLRNGFEPFIATLRSAMRHAGGVRIDHVLGLNRLWLIPEGASAAEGAYVHYPLRDLLNLLILESHRQQAIVIGEDLGTVPPGFRDRLADAGILGMCVLWLERPGDGAGFTPPRSWSANSVAMTTTHDLPTVAGWWRGRDIEWRARIGAEADAASADRRREADRLALAALAPQVAPGGDGIALAIEAIAESPSALLLVPLEDLLGLVEQPNLPGTIDEHPNWRRRLPVPADRLLEEAGAGARVVQLRRLRGG